MIKIIRFNFFILWLLIFLIIFIIINKLIHPIIIMIIIITFNIFRCLNISLWKLNFIFSIIIFLIIIRGLLIIFIYFSRLISNEQIKINFNFKYLSLLILNILIPLNIILTYNQFIFNQFNFITFDSNSINIIFINKFINISNLYFYPLNNLTILTILFLLIAFITIIKINSSTHSFSIRKIYKYAKNYKRFFKLTNSN